MSESRNSSPGRVLGGIAVVVGLLFLGLGVASFWKGQRSEGVEGLVFGGLAFVAGCVILYGQSRRARSKQDESGDTEADAAPDR
jgi:hypothetical protein